MQIKPDGITSILKSRIEGLEDGGADLSEVGTVLSVADGISRVHGLDNAMSMELLAAPHLTQPVGYFAAEDALSARLEHLEDILLSLVHIASVDAFQTWIYTSGKGGDADARDAEWLRLRQRFERGECAFQHSAQLRHARRVRL